MQALVKIPDSLTVNALVEIPVKLNNDGIAGIDILIMPVN